MKPDIRSRANIEILIEEFYRKAQRDPIIGHFFNKEVNNAWEEYIPTICDSWESLLLGTAKKKNSQLDIKQLFNGAETIKPVHFQRWLSLFEKTIDENFEGEKAEEAKSKAKNIAALIQFKLKT